MTRDQREAAGHRGHGQIRFSKDLSRAWVDVKIEGVDLANLTMFHIHCGEPGILGPIIVDFALATDVKQNFADGLFSVELKNEHIAGTAAQGEGHGPVAGFTRGCVIGSPSLDPGKPAKVMTIAGLGISPWSASCTSTSIPRGRRNTETCAGSFTRLKRSEVHRIETVTSTFGDDTSSTVYI